MLGGGGVLGLLSVRPHFCWGGVGAAKGLLPYFLVPKGNQPTACTLALWWLKFGPTRRNVTQGGGGGQRWAGARQRGLGAREAGVGRAQRDAARAVGGSWNGCMSRPPVAPLKPLLVSAVLQAAPGTVVGWLLCKAVLAEDASYAPKGHCVAQEQFVCVVGVPGRLWCGCAHTRPQGRGGGGISQKRDTISGFLITPPLFFWELLLLGELKGFGMQGPLS